MKKRYLLLLPILSSCGRAEAPKEQQKTKPQLTSPDRFEMLHLGMRYDDVFTGISQVSWNPSSLSKCQEELPFKGCLLMERDDESAFRIDGIPLQVLLKFDIHAKLNEINLWFDRYRGVSRLECRDLYARLIDAIVAQYGPLAYPVSNKSSKVFTDHPYVTSAGNKYVLGEDRTTGDFVGEPLRGNYAGVSFPSSKPITKWNSLPYASVFGHFLRLGKEQNCHLAVGFNSGIDSG